MIAAAAIVCAPIGLLSAAASTTGTIVIIPPRSAARAQAPLRHQAFLEQAAARWDARETTAASDMLTSAIVSGALDAPSEAAAKLKLAYMATARKRPNLARVLFADVADQAPGVNDAARAEAAVRTAHLLTGDAQLALLERIVRGEYAVTNMQASQAAIMAGRLRQVRGDLESARDYFAEVAARSEYPNLRVEATTELAAVCFEMAKGEGRAPIPPPQRASMYALARETCDSIIVNSDASVERRMVAELMRFETHFFEGDYRRSYDLGREFLAKWGDEPTSYTALAQRRYINTAVTFQMQSACFLGDTEEADRMAKRIMARPPGEGEQFPNSDSLKLAMITAKLCAHERGQPAEVERYGLMAAQYRPDYQQVERFMQARRETWRVRAATAAQPGQ